LSLRERLHDNLEMVTIFGPVAPEVIRALPSAVAAHLGSAASAPLARTPVFERARQGSVSRVARWGRMSSSARKAAQNKFSVSVIDGLDPSALALRALESGYQLLPLTITVSGEFVAMMLPHALFDGVSAWEQLVPILARAASVADAPRRRRVRMPVIAALRGAGLTSPRALRSARAVRRRAEAETVTEPQFSGYVSPDRGRRLAGLRVVRVPQEQLAAVLNDAVTEKHSRPPSRGMTLVALAIAGAAGGIDSTRDYRVRLNVDLRRYLARGVRVDGAFSRAVPVGTLRRSDNSASALAQRFAGLLDSGAPLAALVGDLAGVARTSLSRSSAGVASDHGRRSFDLGLSVLPSRIPESVWASSRQRLSAAILLHLDEVTNPYIQVVEFDDEVVFAIWDETGSIDQPSFESALAAAIAKRGRATHEQDLVA
jgi:hypothetical protein